MTETPASQLDGRMVKAIAHPLRMRLLTLLNEQVASPSQLAQELEAPLGNVSYHIRILANLGAIELVDTAPRRGAVEHFYRAVMSPWIKTCDWAKLPISVRQSVSGAVLDQISKETAQAVRAGTFDRKENRHLSRIPLQLDDEAFEELRKRLNELLELANELQRQSIERLSASGEAGHASRMVLMHYVVPEDDEDAQAPASS